MKDREGEMWELVNNPQPGQYVQRAGEVTYRLVVTRSVDAGNGRTEQHYALFDPKTMRLTGYMSDLEYGDLPWENRKERRRLA